MADTDDRINELFQRFVQNTCTREEMEELYTWIQDKEDGDVQLLMDERFNNITDTSKADTVDWEHMYRQIIETKRQAPVKRLWYRVAVAASVLLVVSLLGYYIINEQIGRSKDIVRTDSVLHDITAPQTTRATIVLANGEKVYLDSAATGELARQGNMKLEKLSNGQLAYQKTAANSSEEVKFNTINNPKGSQVVTLALADGTKVWLNAGSSLTFPVAFTGTERKVSITGEAYFEVEKDPKKPFRVHFVSAGREGAVEVLGTHFNINAYDDEPAISTTLLEGSVTVTNAGQTALLKPGQQSVVMGNTLKVVDANVEKAIAWKNGYFRFDDEKVESIMRELSRWYGIEVEYRGSVSGEGFSGKISRYKNISQVLKMLEYSGLVHFTLEGRKVIVM